ncbi:MAG TPA: serine protease [Solirubrobacter sp.]|nr:serine protease [Solirubrobacter sp.]
MIIGRHSIYDVERFRTRLAEVERGVVRVTTVGGSEHSLRSTGWLLTDDLVMVPAFALDPAEAVVCERGDERVAARPELGDWGHPGPALLRLERPLSGPLLRLAPGAPTLGDAVFVLQHNGGADRLRFSIGRVLATDPAWVRYDADTEVGSAGAPVLDSGWGVVAMHTHSGGDEPYNQGIALAELVEWLRAAPQWPAIAERHRLTDVAAVRRVLERSGGAEAPLYAAVHWSVDPAALTPEDAARLRPLVVDPDAPRWILPPAERTARLAAAGSLEALRAARGDAPAQEPGQRVIDRVLAGPPYPLAEIADADLPYWLQVVRWFAVDGLPGAAEIARELERRRVRGRLDAIAGDPFRGRAAELQTLREWFATDGAGPLVVTGIGGVGKSALVARFARSLPDATVLLWLDFDRADLAPDDPVSVLRLLFEQLSVQLEGFAAPALDAADWEAALPAFAAVPRALLVLDGFEVAQYARDHREIWQLLERLLDRMPGLHVLVSGRAPVEGLVLRGRAATPVALEGLDEAAARAWLADAGIHDEHVLALTRGVPLILRLAVVWLQGGGDVAELPDTLVEGYLYSRILDRVLDPELKPLARDALVLRRVTEELLTGVLADSLPGGDVADVLARLARELALVGEDAVAGPGLVLPGERVLKLRPELRAATLPLLDAARAAEIDARAAAWYAERETGDPVVAAELVYHRLRLGDVPGAEAAWRPGVASLLAGVEPAVELPSEAAAWLVRRTDAGPAVPRSLTDWEHDAYERIRNLLSRGLVERMAAVLDEQPARTGASPLCVYDAWWRAQQGDAAGALALLDSLPDAGWPVARDRELLAALLDPARADAVLERYDGREHWRDRSLPGLEVLTVRAARIRRTVDLDAELRVLTQPDLLARAREVVPPTDVVHPALAAALGDEREVASAPVEVGPGDALVRRLDEIRLRVSNGRACPLADPAGPDDPLARAGWLRLRLAAPILLEASLLISGTDDQFRALRGALAAVVGHERGTFALVRRGLLFAGELAGAENQLRPPPFEGALSIVRSAPDPLAVLVRRVLGVPDP